MTTAETLLIALAILLVSAILGASIGLIVVQLLGRSDAATQNRPRYRFGWYLEAWDVGSGSRFSTSFYGGLTLGRGEAGKNSPDFLAIGTDPCISRQQCAIYEQNGAPIIWNLGQVNPTHLNGAALTNPVVLQEGDRLFVAGHTLLVTRLLRLE